MKLNDFSLKAKLLLALIPIVFTSAFVSFFIYNGAFTDDNEIKDSLEILDIVSGQEMAMVTMSESLRGYLLNPKDTDEYEKKKKADNEFSELSTKLGALTKNIPEINKLNEMMGKLDADEIDPKETKVAEILKTSTADAQKYYHDEYLPSRLKQNKNFENLKKLATNYANEKIKTNKQNKQRQAITSILILNISILLCLSFAAYLINSIAKSTTRILSFFSGTSSKLSVTSRELLEKSRSLSDATNLEAASVQETSSALHEVTTMAQKNNDSAKSASSLSTESLETTISGANQINQMIKSIGDIRNYQNEIKDVVENGNQKISEIFTVIKNIESKTSVINDIVFQTKLLSFNASVEAARAGENGKGFAVVAEEIGNLAGLSGKASDDIKILLNESISKVSTIIEESRNNLNKTIERAQSLIDTGNDIAQSCQHSLDEIKSNVVRTSDMVQEISVASFEQSKGIGEISVAMGQLDISIQSNSTIATEAHNTSIDLNKLSDELTENTIELKTVLLGKN